MNVITNKSCQFEKRHGVPSLSEKSDVFGAFKIIKMWIERIINYIERMDRVFCTIKKMTVLQAEMKFISYNLSS